MTMWYLDKKAEQYISLFMEDYINVAGVPAVYLPKSVSGQDDIINENIQHEFRYGITINILFIQTPIELDAMVIDKFGLDFAPGGYYEAAIHKNAFSEWNSYEPSIGDIIYIKPVRRFLEVIEVVQPQNVLTRTERQTFWKLRLDNWVNNMDVFPTELIDTFDTMEGVNDLVVWRKNHDMAGIRFEDQHGNRDCIDELNQPVGGEQVTVDDVTGLTPPEDFIDAFKKEQANRGGFARNEEFNDEEENPEDFGFE